jgi:hypothetical protein
VFVLECQHTHGLTLATAGDSAGASALNPAGYQPMMAFFGTMSTLGFGFALLPWLTAGRRHHETLAPIN